MSKVARALVSMAVIALGIAAEARASFHLMQIERVIGGVNGDATAQAIQLRMRNVSQNLVNQGRIRAWDASGANPVVLVDMTTNVTGFALASRILICTPNFIAATTPNAVPDFTMVPIPAAYLAAGKITFENDAGTTVLWSLAWGGPGYLGTNMGATIVGGGNDSDGNYSPPLGTPLPTTTTQAVFFTGAATIASTNNLAQYSITTGDATFTNNAGAAFVVTGAPVIGTCCQTDGMCTGTTQSACMTGNWMNTPCAPLVCPQPAMGACCTVSGSCTPTTLINCPDGVWTQEVVPMTACTPNVCAMPTGACCRSTGCEVLTAAQCGPDAWTMNGDCSPGPCAPVSGSCCTGEACAITTIGACGGVFTLGGVCTLPDSMCCRANFNRDEVKTVADIFAMMSAWFAMSESADWIRDASFTVGDIFAFLAEWFAAC